MGTRSRIAIANPDGTYRSVYCHWDGYPGHHAPILLEHYTTVEKVSALLDLGNLSSLSPEIGEKHDFDAHKEGWCTFYGRDRDESEQDAETSPNYIALQALTRQTGGEWLYVFDGDSWHYAKGGMSMFGSPASKAPGELKPLFEYTVE